MCHFCKRRKHKIYIVEIRNVKRRVCSECQYIYNMIYGQLLSNRMAAIKKIYNEISSVNKHCDICRHFNINNTTYCRKDYWTGIGDYRKQQYPLSYANHGCGRFDTGIE